VLVQLLQHPDYLKRVVGELDDLLPVAGLADQAILGEMTHLELAIKETERLRTITQLLLRVVKKPFTANGYEIPAGWLAFICPPITHRLPELYDNPDSYDPLRHSADHGEPTAQLFGFGGGPHRCLGINFAKYEMKAIIGLLLRRYEIELVDPDPQPDPDVIGAVPPVTPTLVRYRRRPAALGQSRRPAAL
jgi:sterol 14-demethylase